MQSVWKPAVWLHFHADSIPVFFPFHMSAVALTLDVYIPSCHSQHGPNPKWYDLNAAEMHLNVLQNCFLIVSDQKQFNIGGIRST